MSTCDERALPRSIDVTVNVSKPDVASLTDFSKIMIATTQCTFDQGSRFSAYTDIDGVLDDFDSTHEAYKAARDFFSQSPRPTYLLIGRVFTEAVSGFMETRTLEDTVLPATFAAVDDGEFTISIDGDSQNVTGLDFTSVTDFDDVASVIGSGLVGATCVYDATTTDNFIITSSATGESSTVSAMTTYAAGTGTDISGEDFINAQDSPLDDTDDLRIIDGYTPIGIADELSKLDDAAQCGGSNWYGLILTKEFRDDAGDLDTNWKPRLAAAYVETQRKLMGICTNDSLSLSSDITSDIGSDINELGYSRSFVVYHDDDSYYPEISILARLLAVDFDEREGVITTKFKDLPGIPTVGVTSSQWLILQSKRINTFTTIQTDIRTFRDGTCGSPNWYIDERFNIDGLVDTIETYIYNAFLRNDRIPFNSKGRLILESAISKSCRRFEINGTLTARDSTDDQTGDINTEPAYTISVPLAGDVSESNRSDRLWPGISVDVNLSGAVHSVTINLDAYV